MSWLALVVAERSNFTIRRRVATAKSEQLLLDLRSAPIAPRFLHRYAFFFWPWFAGAPQASEHEVAPLKHDVALQVDREIGRAVAVDVAAHDGGRGHQREAQLAGMVREA